VKPRNSTWRRFEGAAMILAGCDFECREERRGAVPFKPLSLGASRKCFGPGVIPLLVFNHDFTYKAEWVLRLRPLRGQVLPDCCTELISISVAEGLSAGCGVLWRQEGELSRR
jgi:hypothetical protein